MLRPGFECVVLIAFGPLSRGSVRSNEHPNLIHGRVALRVCHGHAQRMNPRRGILVGERSFPDVASRDPMQGERQLSEGSFDIGDVSLRLDLRSHSKIRVAGDVEIGIIGHEPFVGG
jgi:hypothetical protein